jgi:hypothetical protein
MLEKIIIDVVENYRTTEIFTLERDTEKRDYYLFFLFCKLSDLSNDVFKFQIEKLRNEDDIESFIEYWLKKSETASSFGLLKKIIDDLLNAQFKLSQYVLPKGVYESFTEDEKEHFDHRVSFRFDNFIKPSEDYLLKRFLTDAKLSLIKNNNTIINEILSIESLNNVDLLTTYDAVEIYNRVLLRLKAMNDPSHLTNNYIYQEVPSDFVDLIMEIGNLEKIDSIYAPYEVTTEQSLYLALEYPNKEIRVESLGETPRHTYRKFALAQAQNFETSYTYCLSNHTIQRDYYDVSLSLLQPKVGKDAKTGHQIEKPEKRNKTYQEYVFIDHILDKLNDNGKAYVILGKRPLFRKSDIEARKYLIENNLVDSIISLPAKIINFCPVPMVMLVLDKAKTTNDVLFINATEFQKEESGRVVLDDIERLAEEFHTRPVLTPFSFTVSNVDIADSNYSLNDFEYMSKEETEQYNLKELSVERKQIMNALVEKQDEINKLLNY